MGRKKLDICYVPQKAKRHGHFNRRIEGLFNKCHELSVICGVPLSLIIDGHKNSVFYENNCKGSSLDTIYAKTSGKVKMYDPETKKFLEIKKPQRTNKSVKPSARKFGNSVNVVEKGKKILVGEQTEGGPRSFVNTHDKYIQQANVDYWPELFNSGLHIFSSGKDMTNVKLHDGLLSQDTFIDAVPELNILDCSMQQGEVDLWNSELDCSSTWNIITDSEHYSSRGFSGGIFTPRGFQDNNATEIGEDDNGGTPILQSRANNLDGSVQEPREHSHHSSELLHYGLDHASSAALDITELDLIDHIFLSSLSPGGFPTAGGCRDNKFWKNYIEGLPYMECILGRNFHQ